MCTGVSLEIFWPGSMAAVSMLERKFQTRACMSDVVHEVLLHHDDPNTKCRATRQTGTLTHISRGSSHSTPEVFQKSEREKPQHGRTNQQTHVKSPRNLASHALKRMHAYNA